jgi:hypothetical protein
MQLIDKTELGTNAIRKIAVYLRYGKKETIAFFIAVSLFSAAMWLPQGFPEGLKFIEVYRPLIKNVLFVISGLITLWVFYRFRYRIALPKPVTDKPLPKGIKGFVIAQPGYRLITY